MYSDYLVLVSCTRVRTNGSNRDSKRGVQSVIHLVVPLIKEQISTNNGGGGNWGGRRGAIE